MIDLNNNWYLLFILLVIVGIAARGYFKRGGLVSPAKEILSLRYSLIMMAVLSWLLYLGLPSFSYYMPEPRITTVEDAREAIREQNEVIKEIERDLRGLRVGAGLFLLVFMAGFVPSFYNVLRTTKDLRREEREAERPILSIFDEDDDTR
jgi:hypothetical protein